MTERKPRGAGHVNNISHGCFGNTLRRKSTAMYKIVVYKKSTYFIMKN